MRRLLLIPILLIASLSFSQIVDQFDYSTAPTSNGWDIHSGIGAGAIVTLTTPSDDGASLSYSGFAPSIGNRISLVAGGGQDINKAISGISGIGYFSFLMKVTNSTGLTTTGDYFTGFGRTAGTNVTVFSPRVFIKTGSTAGTFQLGIQNYTGGTTTQTYSGDYSIGSTVLVVVKLNTTVNPYKADLFINPVPGAVEPTATVTNSSGTAQDFSTFASIFLRQAGNATSGTGNLEIDEIRVGSTWAEVTPAGGPTPCTNTTAIIDTATCATSYTVPSGDETYFVGGTYMDTIPNANGCDSILTINLSFVSSFNFYPDVDGDGFGDNTAAPVVACVAPAGHVMNNDDCDDNDPAIGIGTAFYPDLDGDGLGDNAATAVIACSAPADHVTNNDDCDDTDDQVGVASLFFQDLDGDGFGNALVSITACTAPAGYVADNTDCDDNSATVYPGATEIPDNGIDEDCDGSDMNTLGSQLAIYEFTGMACPAPASALEATTTATDLTFEPYAVTANLTCNAATDVLNYSNFNTSSTINLNQYYSFGITPDDCIAMDLNRIIFTHKISGSGGTPTIHLRSSLDNFATDIDTKQLLNSTAKTDTIYLGAAFDMISTPIEFRWYITNMGASGATYRHDNVKIFGSTQAITPQTFYADADGDGFGDPAVTVSACTAPAGYVADNTDCNDNNPAENPNAIWYADLDGDGLGDANSSVVNCTQLPGYVANADDCDDTDDQIGVEVLYYVDADGDGYGDNDDQGTLSCIVLTGYVTNNGDCDDTNDAVYPGAIEICDGIDNNCDGTIDEGFTMTTYYEDADGDGFGNANVSVDDCTQPAGYVTNADDCDDTNDAINPDAEDETGNGIDENCDGVDGYLGIDEVAFNGLSVYPNPGTTSVVLTANESMNNTVVTFIAVDGKEINLVAAQTASNELTFNTTTLVPGTYFIRLTSDKGTALVRWVKN